MRQLVDGLIGQLRNERLADLKSEAGKSLEQHARELESMYAASDPASTSCDLLQEMLKIVRPIDLSLLGNLLANSDAAAKRLEGKDVIMLVGNTGSGKSSTILFLSGVKMHRVRVQIDESGASVNHFEPVSELSEELKSFVTSPHAQSETRSINSVSVDLSQVLDGANGSVVLCDTPGFGDTAGAEVDITNGIGIVRGVQRSRCAKLVVILNGRSMGDRAESVKALLKTLITLIPSIDEHLESVAYVYTKVSEDDADQLYPRMLDAFKTLHGHEKSDLVFVALLQDLVNKTRVPNVLNLERSSADDIYKKILSCSSITRPGDVFKSFTTTASMQKLQEQLKRTEESIRQALMVDDVENISFRMAQVQQLASLMDNLHACKSMYNTMALLLKNHLEALLADAQNHLKIMYASMQHTCLHTHTCAHIDGRVSRQTGMRASRREGACGHSRPHAPMSGCTNLWMHGHMQVRRSNHACRESS